MEGAQIIQILSIAFDRGWELRTKHVVDANNERNRRITLDDHAQVELLRGLDGEHDLDEDGGATLHEAEH